MDALVADRIRHLALIFDGTTTVRIARSFVRSINGHKDGVVVGGGAAAAAVHVVCQIDFFGVHVVAFVVVLKYCQAGIIVRTARNG